MGRRPHIWRPYDAALPWPTDPTDPQRLVDEIRSLGVRAARCEADLADDASPAAIFDQLYPEIGSFAALLNVHCHSSPGGLLNTTIEDFNQHMRVNAGATFQMCAEFARRTMPGRWSSQERYDVRFEWGPAGMRALACQVRAVVIVDVLRFTSAVDAALSRGAVVYPCSGGAESCAELIHSVTRPSTTTTVPAGVSASRHTT